MGHSAFGEGVVEECSLGDGEDIRLAMEYILERESALDTSLKAVEMTF